MFDKIKSILGLGANKKKPRPNPLSEDSPKPKKERKPKKKAEPVLSAKEQATMNNEPYVNIIKVDLDPNNINNGSFELDFNDKFVLNLVRAGYKIRDDDTDAQIVDRWFQTVCRGIALELYEQQQADPEKRTDMRVVQTRDLGNGRSEVS